MMTCRYCQASGNKDICDLCLWLSVSSPLNPASLCQHCNAPIAVRETAEKLCRLCSEMLQIIRNSVWLVRAHLEWEQENTYRARRKLELLGRSGPFA
jgi:hypothetical protein